MNLKGHPKYEGWPFLWGKRGKFDQQFYTLYTIELTFIPAPTEHKTT